MIKAIQDAYDVLASTYDPSTDYQTLTERDQSADAKRARTQRVTAVTDNLRVEGMIQQADAIERYHAMIDEYVDGQQAVDPATIGSATRDDGRWLIRMYDHARQLLTQR